MVKTIGNNGYQWQTLDGIGMSLVSLAKHQTYRITVFCVRELCRCPSSLVKPQIQWLSYLDLCPVSVNAQFQSAFTCEADNDLPSKGQSPFTAMEEITVGPNGVIKQLDSLNIHKASGPDGLNACRNEIGHVLACIYNASLAQDSVPVGLYTRKGKSMTLQITDPCHSQAYAARPWSI